eukprot:gnl/Spiro4/22471_TR11088_c0_g1_i1.p1 gnl/Spiro4/22471_TR11088_c0_g1~~gnl/Spiro4/22471_TR11088_c0_g1_i1.p1  ORF type:complete len:137 (+),score=23.10 gnl/Spiro4/22471_TR11088_c0_g1_i1:28-411(+)
MSGFGRCEFPQSRHAKFPTSSDWVQSVRKKSDLEWTFSQSPPTWKTETKDTKFASSRRPPAPQTHSLDPRNCPHEAQFPAHDCAWCGALGSGNEWPASRRGETLLLPSQTVFAEADDDDEECDLMEF